MFNKIKDIEYGVKISLEDEGLTSDQCVKIACLSHLNNIPLTMKIGGAEAISDIRIAHNIECEGCVAPMIESSYALHKFISSVFNNSFEFKKLYINVESKQAYLNIENILNSPDAKHLSGIVLGRSDFVQSFGYTKDKVDSDEVYSMAEKIFTLAKKKGLITLMGGNLNVNSLDFIKSLYDKKLLDYVETRNVKVKLTKDFLENYSDNLTQMVRFEIDWLNLKTTQLQSLFKKDIKRISNLKLRN
tara:strand:+ start:1436 stop:2170 length:735 start_codon:yes stop_codon:yes gene_type:complete